MLNTDSSVEKASKSPFVVRWFAILSASTLNVDDAESYFSMSSSATPVVSTLLKSPISAAAIRASALTLV